MRFRAPTLADAPAVLDVLIARDLADIGVPDYTLEDLLDEWRETGVDVAADAVVVLEGDRIVAYAFVRRPGTLAAVHPDHEDRGIGARLLEWSERRTRATGRDRYRQWVSADNARAGALLRGAGYRRARSYWRMARALEGGEEPVTAPDGIHIRSLEVDEDAVALHALDDASFAATSDYNPHSLSEFVDEHLHAHDLRPELSGVAELGDQIIGFALCRCWVEECVGFVDVLAVHPDHQRRGLGSALLRSSFARFAAAGLKEAQLGVASDNPRALALYEGVGMHARFQTDVYERPIATG